MRVLAVAYSYSSSGKSEGLVAFRLAEALRQRGHELTVLTREARPGDAAVSLGRSRLLSGQAGIGKSHKLDYFSFARRCWKYARSRRSEFDLVHHMSPISVRYGNPLSGLGKPFIWGPIGGSIPLPPNFPSVSQRDGLQALRGLDRLRLRFDPTLVRTQKRASRIVLTSEAARRLIPNRFQDKCVVIPEGIDESDFPRDEVPQGHYVMASGRLVPYKGFGFLIRAFAASLDDHDAELWITGDGPERTHLAQLIESSGAGSRVRLLGRVDREENLRLMRGSLFCVFPALNEAFGGVNLEAMAAGKPIIVTDWGGPADLVMNGVNGYKIVPSGEGEFIACIRQRIQSLLDDEGARRRMGEAALQVARKHVWSELAIRYETVYQNAVASKDQS